MLTFDLRIPVTAAAAAAIKRDVASSLPDIKSSHLSEAVARGLGFNTHASLLAAVGAGGEERRMISGEAFSAFLRERDYDAAEKGFYIAAARVAIRNVMDAQPRLSHWGYYVGRPKRKPDGKWENPKEHHARFLQEREQLLTDGAVEEFLRSLALVQRIRPIQTINLHYGSYSLKHDAENLKCAYPGGMPLGPFYVSNGSLIVAAVHAGFRYKTFVDHLGYEDVNVAFNMSQTSLDEVLFQFVPARVLSDERKLRAHRRLTSRAT